MATSSIDITGLSKAAVLAALYNRAQPQGLGFIHFDPTPWTEADAEAYITNNGSVMVQSASRLDLYFDYVKGRVVKCDLSGDSFDSSLFNRDNGSGAAESVIEELRKNGA